LLDVIAAFLFASSFAHVLIAGSPGEEVAGSLATLFTILMYAFCGILAAPSSLPRFWIFMYRVNPFTYLVSSFMSATLGEAPAFCASNEFLNFDSPEGKTCGEYMQSYISMAGGYLTDPQATGTCNYCQLSSTTEFLLNINVDFGDRWWHLGILFVFIVVNVVGAFGLYWLCRVPRKK
jgi:ATP-binding cassette, subfamily G (WHITE), member 2, PDR